MKRTILIVTTVVIIGMVQTGRVALAQGESACALSYKEATDRLDQMLGNAEFVVLHGSATTAAVQTSLVLAGVASAGGLVSGGAALVGTAATISALKARKRSLSRVLKLYRKAQKGELESVELAERVLRLLDTGEACHVKRDGQYRPRGFSKFMKKLRKGTQS